MRKKVITPLLLIFAATSLRAESAAAGDAGAGQKRCDAPAETCVRAMAEGFKKKGWIGIEMRETDAEGRPMVTRIVPESPAERSGFRLGDALAAFNGVATTSGEEKVNQEIKRSMLPGREITVTVLRAGRPVDLAVTLGTIPDYLAAQWIGYHMLEGHSSGESAEAPRP